MSKKPKDKKAELPLINEKYVNPHRIDEAEGRIHEQLSSLTQLKQESMKTYNDLLKKDQELFNSTKSYDKLLDDKNRKILSLEEELTKLKQEINQKESSFNNNTHNKMIEMKENFEKRVVELVNQIDILKEKLEKKIEKKNRILLENERLLKEKNESSSLYSLTVDKYEKTIIELKENHENQIKEYQKREEEYLHSNANLLESDIFTVYKEIQEKFETRLKENISLKGQNDRISDENKIAKLSNKNNENLLKDCAAIQVKQQKLIKQYKENLDDLSKQLNKKKEEYQVEFEEYNFKIKKILTEKDEEMQNLRNQLKIKSDENYNLRILSQMILDQRSEIEQFFIESLEEVKQEIYKKKKEMQKKSHLFPNLEKKYEEKVNLNRKVDIRDLTPEDKEKVLRYLFSKINENFKPKNYRDVQISDLK